MATVTEELLILIKSIGGIGAARDVDQVAAASRRSGAEARAATKEHLGFKSALGSLKGIALQTAGIAGIGGLAVGVGAAVKSAQAFQVQNARLGVAIKNNVRFPARDATEQLDKFAESLAMKGGFAPTDALQSMARLLGVTRDVGRTQRDLSLASNIARGTHVDLGRATRAVMMVEAGRTTGLARMGIFLKQSKAAEDALTASKGKHTAAEKEAAKAQDQTATRISGMTQLWQKFGGQTAAYSKTASGSISNLRNTVEILGQKLGSKLLPIITTVVQALSQFVSQMMEGRGVGGQVVDIVGRLVGVFKDLYTWLKPLWPVLAGIVVVWAAWNVQLAITATFAWIVGFYKDLTIALEALKLGQAGVAAAQLGLNVAFLASPVFWIVAAIVALVVVFVLLWTHVKGFRDFWKDAWKWIKQAAKDVVDWLTVAWRQMTQWISNAASNASRWITNAFHNVIQWFKSNWPYLLGALTGPFGLAAAWIYKHWSQVKKLPQEIAKAFMDAASAIANAIVWPFKWAFNWVKQHLPTFHTHHIGPIPIPLPSFPGLAGGGVTPYGGAFVVGERGPELVTLPQGASVSSQDDLKQTNQLLRELIAAVQQNSNALIVDGKVLAQSVMRQGLLQSSRS